MLLQVALDVDSAKKAIEVCDKVHDIVDFLELDITYDGVNFIRMMKDRYPNSQIVADLKTTAYYFAHTPLDYGADFVSMASTSSPSQIAKGVKYAHDMGRGLIGDMGHSRCDAENMILLDELGCDQISLYPHYIQDQGPVHDTLALEVAKKVIKRAQISVYGGMTVQNMAPVCELKPDILVIGKAIWAAEDPRRAVYELRELMAKYE